MIDIKNAPKRLRGKEAAEYLAQAHGIVRTPGTLAKLRCVGGGPVFQIAGRSPLYSLSDLDQWAEQLLSPRLRSTSDRGHEFGRATMTLADERGSKTNT